MKLLIVALCLAAGPNLFIRVSENESFEIINFDRYLLSNINRNEVVEIYSAIAYIRFISTMIIEYSHRYRHCKGKP